MSRIGENKRASAKVGVRNFLQRKLSRMDKLKNFKTNITNSTKGSDMCIIKLVR
ncbi:MAG: hypothetical protein IJ583_14145 [Firmicutes bacterium]|nr:hypothetical protein [Bacillota bacterium]